MLYSCITPIPLSCFCCCCFINQGQLFTKLFVSKLWTGLPHNTVLHGSLYRLGLPSFFIDWVNGKELWEKRSASWWESSSRIHSSIHRCTVRSKMSYRYFRVVINDCRHGWRNWLWCNLLLFYRKGLGREIR